MKFVKWLAKLSPVFPLAIKAYEVVEDVKHENVLCSVCGSRLKDCRYHGDGEFEFYCDVCKEWDNVEFAVRR